jgi:hypothetical protein
MKVINPSSSWGNRLKALLENDFPDLTHLDLSLNGMGVDQDWKKRDW